MQAHLISMESGTVDPQQKKLNTKGTVILKDNAQDYESESEGNG